MSFMYRPFLTSFLLIQAGKYFKAQTSTAQAKMKNNAALKLPHRMYRQLFTSSIPFYKCKMIVMPAPVSRRLFL